MAPQAGPTEESRINAWFNLAFAMMADTDWELAASRPDASLFYRACPWGGHLIKIDLKNLLIEDAPEKATHLLVRPEVRGQHHDRFFEENKIEWQETLAPGDALVEQAATMFILRMATLLFGNLACCGPFMQKGCLEARTPAVLARHQLRRDFPEEGDCTYACFTESDGVGQEQITICRNTERPQRFRVVLVFTTEASSFGPVDWTSPCFRLLTDTASTVVHWYMNRPGVQEMRAIDANLYICLAMRNYNRGPPMIPDKSGSTDIRASNLCSWTRFQTGPDGKFRFAPYLKCFIEQLGHSLPIYDTLDGKALVPYQCMMLRQQWEAVRDHVIRAMTLQRAAYRRANGGSRAPSLAEDAVVRYAGVAPEPGAALSFRGCFGELPELKAPWRLAHKTICRKTTDFEDEANEVKDEIPMRKTKSESTARTRMLTFSV